jgi:hypothetical protein
MMGGDRDSRDLNPFRLGYRLHLANQRNTVIRHRNIGHQHMRAKGFEDSLGPCRGLGGPNKRAAILQCYSKHFAGVVGVFDNQDMNAFKVAMGHG